MTACLYYRLRGRIYRLRDFAFVPASLDSRKEWVDSLTNLAGNLSLYTHTSLNDALSMSSHDVVTFFNSKAFAEFKKAKESELKIHVAGVNRANEIIKSIGILAKIMSR